MGNHPKIGRLFLFFLLCAGVAPLCAETIEGEVEIIIADNVDNTSEKHFFIKKDGGLKIEFTPSNNETASQLITGSRIRVTGSRTQPRRAFMISSAQQPRMLTASSLQVLTQAVVPHAGGNKKLLALLVNFQNDTRQPFTLQEIAQTLNGPVNNFMKEVSFDQTSLTVTTQGWFTLPMNIACTNNYIDLAGIRSLANTAAANAGINVASYDRVMYFFPNAGCGSAAWAHLYSNVSWINGHNHAGLISHELGHNFGFDHARSMDCGAVPLTTTPSACSQAEYGDFFDTMGSNNGHYSADKKEQVGWISTQKITASGDYTIHPYELAGSVVKALYVGIPGSSQRYYLEYRQPIGVDGYIQPAVANGLFVRFYQGAYGNSILKMPPSFSFNTPSLPIGQSYTEPFHGITFTPLSNSPTALVVRIQIPGTTADSIAPNVSITSPQNGATVSGSVVISAMASDNVGVSKVEFHVDGVLKFADVSNPYAYSCDTASTANGPHTLKAKAFDAAGNTRESTVINVTVNNTVATPPTPPTPEPPAPPVSSPDPLEKLVFNPTIETIQFNCANAIEIYARNGKHLATLPCAGTEATWNGRTTSGPAASGTYLAKENGKKHRRFVILK